VRLPSQSPNRRYLCTLSIHLHGSSLEVCDQTRSDPGLIFFSPRLLELITRERRRKAITGLLVIGCISLELLLPPNTSAIPLFLPLLGGHERKGKIKIRSMLTWCDAMYTFISGSSRGCGTAFVKHLLYVTAWAESLQPACPLPPAAAQYCSVHYVSHLSLSQPPLAPWRLF